MSDDDDTQDGRDPIRPVDFEQALSERYLAYALSTIMARSLPDVRDGLKPVHRRLLYAMRELGLNPRAGFKKCARVVGDVMGKFHPHGDAAIYDAMVRLAQEFAVRYPLVEGQGNFGNIDGDNPAAMRYTEARLTAIAEALLEGIDEDTVDFRDTYDGEGAEPVVLPAAFPNLLANGAQGIAVGMATNIPPHNADELCQALLLLIKNPEASLAQVMKRLPGPDFPTGGVLVEDADKIAQAYATGRGSLRLRARWEKEDLGRGQWQAVVTEIPYQVQKSRLVEKIAELLDARRLPLLVDVRDESAEDVRLVLVPKTRSIPPEALMESLFQATELETRFGLNMNVLDGGTVPRLMGLVEVLKAFLDHRLEVLQRRTQHRLGQIAHRLEVLEGYLIVYANLDEVIRLIRESDEPKPALMARWDLTEVQADAILNMRLRALARLQEIEIRAEHAKLTAEQAELQALLADESLQWATIGGQIGDIRAKFGAKTPLGARRTEIAGTPEAVDLSVEALVEREPVTVVVSEQGWVRALKGHLAPDAEVKYKDGDGERFRVPCQTTDRLLLFTAGGRVYTLAADKLPGGRGQGEPLRLLVDVAAEDEPIALLVAAKELGLILASSDGRGFRIAAEACIAQTKGGRQVMTPAKGARLAVVHAVAGDHVAVIGENRRLLVFPLSQLAEMSRGRGVMLQRYKGAGLSDLTTLVLDEGLSWQAGERVRRETDLVPWLGNRA
ncbi:MAG: DNA topoisomerase IV subunit A, partial [Alphaproteobacteria bacterium]|nr:DNA topoisomerase IV subunit A [Alphaproteobacteria bacterium]